MLPGNNREGEQWYLNSKGNLMCMKVCLCIGVCVFLWVMGGSVGSQGRTGGGDGVG